MDWPTVWQTIADWLEIRGLRLGLILLLTAIALLVAGVVARRLARGIYGTVKRVGLRQTVLRSVDGGVHFIPNSKIDVVTNMTKGNCYCLLNVGVAFDARGIEIPFPYLTIYMGRTKEGSAPPLYVRTQVLGVET